MDWGQILGYDPSSEPGSLALVCKTHQHERNEHDCKKNGFFSKTPSVTGADTKARDLGTEGHVHRGCRWKARVKRDALI